MIYKQFQVKCPFLVQVMARPLGSWPCSVRTVCAQRPSWPTNPLTSWLSTVTSTTGKGDIKIGDALCEKQPYSMKE